MRDVMNAGGDDDEDAMVTTTVGRQEEVRQKVMDGVSGSQKRKTEGAKRKSISGLLSHETVVRNPEILLRSLILDSRRRLPPRYCSLLR
jgi:hypothetical protein